MTLLPQRKKAFRRKHCYVGAPAIFRLEHCCTVIGQAWREEAFGCYLVGSCLERPDFRDVDVRMIMSDDAFAVEFPDVHRPYSGTWEFDPKWTLLTIAISGWMREQTGLPVDFQMQPQSWANARHDHPRNAMGLTYSSPRREPAA